IMGFFKTMLASLVGMIIAGILLIFIFIFMLSAMFQSSFEDFANESGQSYQVENNSVLHLRLNNPIVDNGPIENLQFSGEGFDNNRIDGLNSITESVRRAAKDDKIKGIFLEVQLMDAGMATVEELRNTLVDFKKSGKFIYSYAEYYDTKAYYLASVADRVVCFPDGLPAFIGLSSQSFFLKGMLDKLEVDVTIIRGSNNKFKSAVEPFMLDRMSDANRKQVSRYVGVLWSRILKGVSDGRKISEENLTAIADSVLVTSSTSAKNYKLIDDVMYRDEFMDLLAKKAGWKKNETAGLVSLGEYLKDKRVKKPLFGSARALRRKAESKKDQVAVIYASGEIIDGKGNKEIIGSETLAKQIRRARLNKKVKAIVLRINSPGGSALASEVIWRETQLAKKEKPVIVSMGDLAASGGYYIACGADRIYAQPSTLTGSIGVFGVLPNVEKLFKNKMGITFDRVTTNPYADMGSLTRSMKDFEFNIIQREVDNIYETFAQRVSEGRKLDKTLVKDSIGQGRVWTGEDALALGLVDKLGGLQDAIDYAIKKAKLKDYIIREYPRVLNPLEEFFLALGDKDADDLEESENSKKEHLQELVKSIKLVYPNLPKNMLKHMEDASRMLQRKGTYTYLPWYTEVK
ncbi:MAG: signal peptide peptidase SppA, partial [Flavobacteriales bacterium]